MSFAHFLLVLRARFALIVTVTALCALLALVLTLVMPSRYYAEASALIEPPATDVTSVASLNSTSMSNFLATQRDVVASRNVAVRVIERLELEKDPARSRRLLAGTNPIGILLGTLSKLLPGSDDVVTFRDYLVMRLLKQLSVTTGRDSRLIKVGFSARDPEFAAAVANSFMRAYLEANVALKASPARAETTWLDGQLKELRETLETAEAKLSAFQQEKGITATDERVDYENSRLADLSTQLVAAQSETYAAEARRRQLRNFAASQAAKGDIPGEVLSNPVVISLRQDIAQREARLQDMSRQIGPNHPRYRAAAGELEQLRGQLGSEMRSVAQGMAASGGVSGEREASLRRELQQQKTRVLALKKDREMLAQLSRDVENAQRFYNTAAQRASQARIEGANERPNASVVDQAVVPLKPAFPRLVFNLPIGVALGLALGLGLALLLESTYGLVRSEQELVEVAGVPLLAVLPRRLARGPMARALGSNIYSLPKP